MKNIAILIPTIKPGGAEKQATLLATLLDKHYKVDMYLYLGYLQPAPQNLRLLEKSNVKVHPLKGSTCKKIKVLSKLLKKNNTDILFNYMTNCDIIGCIAAKIAKVKIIYGGIRSSRLPWWKIVMERFVHNRHATATIYNCYSGAEYFGNKGFKKDKNIVIPNCFQNIAEPIIRQEREVKHIVTVGRFVPDKDYRTIIRTIAELKELRKDFVMDIIGYGTEEQNIRNWIKEYGVEEYIKIYIRPDNVQDIVRDADIYLSTSLFEGTSNSIMEALNWSLPVVATNVGDNDRLVIDGVNGTLHPIGDAKGMAESIAKLIGNYELRKEYGQASNKNLRENYSMEIFEKRYLKLIEE